MSLYQTTASGERLTLICHSGDQAVTQKQADMWLRQRQALQQTNQRYQQRLAS